jgi:hypothetical protein
VSEVRRELAEVISTLDRAKDARDLAACRAAEAVFKGIRGERKMSGGLYLLAIREARKAYRAK